MEIFFGCLVIGNDAKFGGIAINNTTVALPIQGSNITLIKVSDLNKYFPSHYTILETRNELFLRGYGNAKLTFNNIIFCRENCRSNIATMNNGSLFIENNFYGLGIGRLDIFESIAFY